MPDELVVDPHTCAAGGERFARIHPKNDRKRVFLLARGRQFHQGATGVSERNTRANTGKRYRCAFLDLHLEPVRDEAHYAGGLDPRDLLKLCLALGQRNKKDVATNVTPHDFHDLGVSDAVNSDDLDVVARFNAEAPRMLAVAIDGEDSDADYENDH